MKTNKEFRALARKQLKGNWGMGIGICFVYALIVCASSFTFVGSLILTGPLLLGLYIYFLHRVRGENAKFEDLFDGFKNFGSALLLFVLQGLFICLWSMLLIVPGVVKAFSYSMSFFILRDNPDIGAAEAITRSRAMMQGHKWRLFCLSFSFIGWVCLCYLSLGIGFLWLTPYMMQSFANFYEDLKGEAKPRSSGVNLSKDQ